MVVLCLYPLPDPGSLFGVNLMQRASSFLSQYGLLYARIEVSVRLRGIFYEYPLSFFVQMCYYKEKVPMGEWICPEPATRQN